MVESETSRAPSPDRYEELRAAASEAVYRGRLREAYGLFEQALELARAGEDRNLEDLAYCNLAAVAIRMERTPEMASRLQQILLRTTDPRVALLSAYNLSLSYDRPDTYRKSLFYARISLRYATELGDRTQEASSINQVGNILCATNHFESSLEHFEKAERLLGGAESPHTAQVLDNLGYCHVVLGDYERGFGYLFRSLRMFRALGVRVYEAQPRLTLCFAYLHVGRPARAVQHGVRAFELAEEIGDLNAVKYALLLLGEAYKMGGDLDAAQECFLGLQEIFYPEMPEVPEMLFSLDLCKMINLRA